jgi:glycosyltransferase involved in cell wall biosynthesis
MKIALDTRLVYYRRYSGIGQYIVQLAERLPGLDPAHQYTLIHSRKDRTPPRANPLPPNARLHAAWTPCHNRWEQLIFPIELGPLKIDLLHSPDFIPPFRSRFKRVITVHDLNFLYYPQFLTAESLRYYNGQIERAVTVADHILADSFATRQDLIKLLNVPDSKISVVWLAPNIEVYQPQGPPAVEAARARHQLPARFILFAGTLEPRKNVDGLLRAYRLLRDRDPHPPALILAGSRGWLFDETRALVADLQLADHVRWIETPADAELAAMYTAASAFVLPSHYEGFGLTVLEAMACGAPCVIGNRGSLPEIAGGAAIQVDPGDVDELSAALERVLNDEALQQRLRQAGLAQAKGFSWQRCARETLAVYQQVIRG